MAEIIHYNLNEDFKDEIKYSLISGVFSALGSVFANLCFDIFLMSDCEFATFSYTPINSMNFRYFCMNTSFALTLLSMLACDSYLRCALSLCRDLRHPTVIAGVTNTILSSLLGVLIYGTTTSTLAWSMVGFIAIALGAYNFIKYDVRDWYQRNEIILQMHRMNAKELRMKRSGGK